MARRLLRLPVLTSEAKSKAMQDTAWADVRILRSIRCNSNLNHRGFEVSQHSGWLLLTSFSAMPEPLFDHVVLKAATVLTYFNDQYSDS